VTQPLRRVLPIGLSSVLLLAACAGISPPPGGGGGGAGGPVVHPGGTAVVARVEYAGGLVPYETIFTSLPHFTLVGDGRVILQGPISEQFPGPALPNLQVRRVTEEGIQAVIARIAETGLFDETRSFNSASQVVADAQSTVFTLRADSRETIVDVYGLGMFVEGEPPEGVPPDEVAAHRTLTALEADLVDLESWIPADDWAESDWQPYEPTAFRLLVSDVTDEPPTPEEGDPMPWPGSTPPGEIGEESPLQGVRCGLVMGNEAAAWYEALSQANQLTKWSHDGHVYRVTPRPLLPDETLDCGPAAA
jgi:hypothetical protein